VREISAEVKQLAERARDGRLAPDEFMGGTFTISNLGMFGVGEFAAIVNPPQAAILAVGTAVKRLTPDAASDAGFRTQTVMTVTLSCDHRVVDGAVGAQWLQAFKACLEDPVEVIL
jgi:pyruvate dehydrogenase E2 component (dihydrolipoamide acetyltransferase)